MGIKILGEYAKPEDVIMHKPKHDMGSLIYILVWVCVLYENPQVGDDSRNVNSTCLSAWVSPKNLQQVRNLAVFKCGDLHNRVAVSEFMNYFQDLKETIGLLYDALH